MKKNRGFEKMLLIVLVVALIAVAAVIVYKQMEYDASEDFYNGLRGAVELGRKLL